MNFAFELFLTATAMIFAIVTIGELLSRAQRFLARKD